MYNFSWSLLKTQQVQMLGVCFWDLDASQSAALLSLIKYSIYSISLEATILLKYTKQYIMYSLVWQMCYM